MGLSYRKQNACFKRNPHDFASRLATLSKFSEIYSAYVAYYSRDDDGFLGSLGLPESESALFSMVDVRNFSKCTVVDDAEQISLTEPAYYS